MRTEPTWAVHILYHMMLVPREQACTHFHGVVPFLHLTYTYLPICID